MASSTALSMHDTNVLSKIHDPESSPSNALLISDSLPRDPYITSAQEYQSIARRERDILISVQQPEIQYATSPSETSQNVLRSAYRSCIKELSSLIDTYPNYASARNNRAQALRRMYGDSIIIDTTDTEIIDTNALISPTDASPEEVVSAARTILADLSSAIRLLNPRTPFTAISPQAARTLANAYTQRGAVFHGAAKMVPEGGMARLRFSLAQAAGDETTTTGDDHVQMLPKTDLEQLASHDFAMGGRYGNEIARNLAVASNPTAKLCGEMVREAMRKEMMGEN